MTQENKQLFIKDLCSRFPYGVRIEVNGSYIDKIVSIELDNKDELLINFEYKVENIKPYLFPMSSMTEEQKEEILKISLDTILNDSLRLNIVDWFNKYHFDYRGLINKGLAIDASILNIY